MMARAIRIPTGRVADGYSEFVFKNFDKPAAKRGWHNSRHPDPAKLTEMMQVYGSGHLSCP